MRIQPPRDTAARRRSSSTRPSIRTRRLTSVTCAIRRWATRSSACCAFAAFLSRCRTTSTTPVQVADVVVGFLVLERKTLDEIRLADSTRFDYYCWDLYARVTEWTRGRQGEVDPSREDAARHRTRRERSGRYRRLDRRPDRARHLQTMGRMNVDYDLLSWEGDILRLKFWAQAFDVLKASGAVYLQTEGRLAGCWVMPIATTSRAPGPRARGPGPKATVKGPLDCGGRERSGR